MIFASFSTRATSQLLLTIFSHHVLKNNGSASCKLAAVLYFSLLDMPFNSLMDKVFNSMAIIRKLQMPDIFENTRHLYRHLILKNNYSRKCSIDCTICLALSA